MHPGIALGAPVYLGFGAEMVLMRLERTHLKLDSLSNSRYEKYSVANEFMK